MTQRTMKSVVRAVEVIVMSACHKVKYNTIFITYVQHSSFGTV